LLNDNANAVRASQAALLSPGIALFVTLLLLLLFFLQGPEFAYWWARIDDCMGKWQQLQQVGTQQQRRSVWQQQQQQHCIKTAWQGAAASGSCSRCDC
jgi:hypothetical protein